MKTCFPNIEITFFRTTDLFNENKTKTYRADYVHFKNINTGQKLHLTRYNTNPVISTFDWTEWHSDARETLIAGINRLGVDDHSRFIKELL